MRAAPRPKSGMKCTGTFATSPKADLGPNEGHLDEGAYCGVIDVGQEQRKVAPANVMDDNASQPLVVLEARWRVYNRRYVLHQQRRRSI